jgi:hypothetical protein
MIRKGAGIEPGTCKSARSVARLGDIYFKYLKYVLNINQVIHSLRDLRTVTPYNLKGEGLYFESVWFNTFPLRIVFISSFTSTEMDRYLYIFAEN